jgi:predicted dehydrogenase
MTRSPARIAVVGAGLIGRRHIDAIVASRGAVLAAVVDPQDAAGAAALAQGVPLYRDLDTLIAAGGLDGIVLATPNALHVAGGLACIVAGLPVLVEKPLATDVAQAHTLVDAAERAGIPLLVGHHRRHNPLIAAARAMLATGDIGTPVSVQGQFWLMKPDDYFATPWRAQPGAGPIFLNLIHDIDLMRHLLGEITAVQAAQSSAVRGHAVEETAVILLEFANGVLGTMNVSDTIPAPWSWELTSGENPAYPVTDQSCYRIGGTLGALEVPSLRLWHQGDDRGWFHPLSTRSSARPAGDPLVLQIEHFARVIRGEEAPLVSGREGLRTLAVIEAIKKAAKDGSRVVL